MLKVLQTLDATLGNRVAPKTNYVQFTSEVGLSRPYAAPDHRRLLVGATLHAASEGPVEYLEEFKREARSAMAHELYGEITADLQELRVALYSESFRPSTDPIMKSIHAIIDKTRGN